MDEGQPGFFGSTQRDLRLWPWFVGGSVLLLVVLLVVSNRSGTPQPQNAAPSTSYSLDVTGTAPHVQAVGVPFDAAVTVKNTGATIQHVLMDLLGCNDHWVVDGVTVAGQPEQPTGGQTYDLGQFLAGDSEHVALTLAPSQAGNHECDLSFFKDSTDSAALETVDWKPAINP